MNSPGTLILTQAQVAELLGIKECIGAIEGVFHLHGKKETQPPAISGIHVANGGFHIKSGVLNLGRNYFVSKTNANFPNNPKLHSLPTIQGVVAVFDGDNGRLLALMDSIEITILRTGAATAVAAKFLASPDANTVTICGCGNQGRISLKALSEIFSLSKVYAYDIDSSVAQTFAREMAEDLSLAIEVTNELSKATRQSEIIVTCTPSKRPFLRKSDVAPGTFIAAVGSDSEEKQELEPDLLGSSKLIADVREQCATIGELHHAIERGLMTRENVYAELGEVISGRKRGRESKDEIIVFDSTGMALQDVAAAAIVYEKALLKGTGLEINFGNKSNVYEVDYPRTTKD